MDYYGQYEDEEFSEYPKHKKSKGHKKKMRKHGRHEDSKHQRSAHQAYEYDWETQGSPYEDDEDSFEDLQNFRKEAIRMFAPGLSADSQDILFPVDERHFHGPRVRASKKAKAEANGESHAPPFCNVVSIM